MLTLGESRKIISLDLHFQKLVVVQLKFRSFFYKSEIVGHAKAAPGSMGHRPEKVFFCLLWRHASPLENSA